MKLYACLCRNSLDMPGLEPAALAAGFQNASKPYVHKPECREAVMVYYSQPDQDTTFVYTPNRYILDGNGQYESGPIYQTEYALLQAKKVFRLVNVRD